ncbi:MAG: DNA repair protein RecO [Bacteroidota bacterium]|nr:DNA repair protein RecO [Bacteroidota bacterium]
MIVKTRGIVLHFIKYSETSVIATVYTEMLGLQSFLIKGIRGKKSKGKANILQPLSLLEMDVFYKEKRELQTLGEFRSSYPFNSIPYDIRKTTIAIFLAEILYRSIKEHEANAPLFDFLENSIRMLDMLEEGVSDYHLYFLCHYSGFLGFAPENNYSEENCFFDMKAGRFVAIEPRHPSYMKVKESSAFSCLLSVSPLELLNLNINHKERIALLDRLLDYFTMHFEAMEQLNSLNVLKELFG